MRRLTVLFIPLLLAGSEGASAQATEDSSAARTRARLCYRARPRPACSAFVLTNFGSYVVLGSDETGDTPLRGVADWGLMVNVGTRDAVGASVFASLDQLGFALGPAVRYRRWIPPSRSFEVAVGVAVGTPLVGTDDIETGSVFGVVKWSPNHWLAVAARPELIRQRVFLCGPTTCNEEVRSRGRVSLGVETGWVPGLVLTGVSGAALLAIVAIIVSSGID